MRQKISFIFGTRPEAIKLCPLILMMREHLDKLEPHICVTGQHREMLAPVLDVFGVKPDVDLELMTSNQTLAGFTSRAIEKIDCYLSDHHPDRIVVQGDTTSVLCASLAAFYHRIPIAHIEAGLRTWNNDSPFPEEINRVLTTRMADMHFAPTQRAKENLLKESVEESRIFLTGNTVIDALLFAVEQITIVPPKIAGLDDNLQPGTPINSPRMVLITGHRRENFGHGFENICLAIVRLAEIFRDVHFVYPVHLNPNVQEPVRRILTNEEHQFRNIHLIDPLSYLPFVAMMKRSTLVLTDSGGVQEEAPSLGKPVLVMRDTTERPEAVEAGTVKLVGTDTDLIVSEATRLLIDPAEYDRMSHVLNPYGDGHACERIVRTFLSGC